MTRHTTLRLLACTSALVLASPAALAQKVGTAGAVNPSAYSTPPRGTQKVIELGQSVIHKERIRTEAAGSVQLLFIDKTSMNIGPNSDIVIDEYVYDPNRGTGSMAVTVTKGVLRFVGGNVSHTSGATITTPSASLGVRGGVVQVEQQGGQGKAVLLYGRLTVSSAQGTEVIRKPGWGVFMGPGGQISPPQQIPAAALAAMNTQLIPAGRNGGARQVPSNELANRQLGPGTGGRAPDAIASLQGQTVAQNAANVSTAVALQQATTDARQGQQVQATQVVAEQTIAEQKPVRMPAAKRAFALNNPPNAGSGAPYLPPGFVAAGTFRNSQILGYSVGGTREDGTPNTASRVLQAGLNITGQGASQTSTIYVMTGQAYLSDKTNEGTFGGGFAASTRRSASQSAGFASGSASGAGTGVALDAGYTPTRLNLSQATLTAEDRLDPAARASYFPGGGVGATQYTYTQNATQAPTPSGLGVNRPTAELTGYAGGLGRTYSLSTNTATSPTYPLLGYTYVNLNEDQDRFGAGVLAFANTTTTTDAFQYAYNFFGYQDGFTGLTPAADSSATTGSGRGTYVDYDNFAARDSRLTTGEPISFSNGATVDPGSRALFVNSKVVDVAASFPGVTFCNCEYTRWGFWSQDNRRTVGGDTRQDLVHLGTWVAGRAIQQSDVPLTGTATYTGHAIASIKNGVNEYVAAGSLTSTVNFGTRTGIMAVNGMDGANYSGALTLSSAPYLYGALGSSVPGRSMQVQGELFRGPGGPVHEMGGNVTIMGGTTYMGSGIFAASR